ncbi:MAG: hypothetical protein LDL51_13435 [Chloroflexi bacterium]|nr:hypothetical protein [Chloroflexota bacterium]
MKNAAFNLLFLFALSAAWSGVFRVQAVAAQEASPTPYDPLVEPPLPPNPTELELGRNLYWHWCMTCHGDRGQGLTDEFREIWEEDHQNCWAKGCHAGRPGDTGFPIPTYVPPVTVEDRLSQFDSLRGLAGYLKATHPPQSPGALTDEEYHAIALFVFAMNGRGKEESAPLSTPSPPTAAALPLPSAEDKANPRLAPADAAAFIFAGLLTAGFVFFFRRRANKERGN